MVDIHGEPTGPFEHVMPLAVWSISSKLENTLNPEPQTESRIATIQRLGVECVCVRTGSANKISFSPFPRLHLLNEAGADESFLLLEGVAEVEAAWVRHIRKWQYQ